MGSIEVLTFESNQTLLWTVCMSRCPPYIGSLEFTLAPPAIMSIALDAESVRTLVQWSSEINMGQRDLKSISQRTTRGPPKSSMSVQGTKRNAFMLTSSPPSISSSAITLNGFPTAMPNGQQRCAFGRQE